MIESALSVISHLHTAVNSLQYQILTLESNNTIKTNKIIELEKELLEERSIRLQEKYLMDKSQADVTRIKKNMERMAAGLGAFDFG